MSQASGYRLAINQCPIHGYMSVSLDDDNGGHRLTSGKCCGRWHTIKTWPMSEGDLEEAIEVFTKALGNREKPPVYKKTKCQNYNVIGDNIVLADGREIPLNSMVTVCANCLQASCWHGEFYCEKYKSAGTKDLSVRDLLPLAREHPHYWITQE